MKNKAFLLLFLFTALFSQAQNPKEILDKANQTYTKSGGIKASFTLDVEDTKQKITYSQDGKIDLLGDKFKINSSEAITWFDGKTQWSYLKGSDEVNVSNPTGEELAAISPAVLLNMYKQGFKLSNKGLKNDNGKSAYSIELIPESKKSDLKRMVINIDKSTYLFTSVQLYLKDGTNNNLKIKILQQNVTLPASTFIFNKKEYPNVEVIDLR